MLLIVCVRAALWCCSILSFVGGIPRVRLRYSSVSCVTACESCGVWMLKYVVYRCLW